MKIFFHVRFEAQCCIVLISLSVIGPGKLETSLKTRRCGVPNDRKKYKIIISYFCTIEFSMDGRRKMLVANKPEGPRSKFLQV